jgi:urea transport system ATP-binding protein
VIAAESIVTHRPYEEDKPSVNGLWDKKYLLFLEGVTAVFDGFKALDIPAFGIGHKELRVVIGPNGAGKTTMCDVISGKTIPTTGDVFYDGMRITDLSDTDIALMGVRRKFQTPTVYDSLTAYENMELAVPGRHAVWSNLFQKTLPTDRDRIMEILARVKLSQVANTLAKNLSHGQRQWLAISTLILSDPKLLLVDEPAAGTRSW